MQDALAGVPWSRGCAGTCVDLLAATRTSREIYLGASPRAGIALVRAAKALAVLRGRDYVVPQDVKDLAGPRARATASSSRPTPRLRGDAEEAVVARHPRDRAGAGAVRLARPTARGVGRCSSPPARYVAARMLGHVGALLPGRGVRRRAGVSLGAGDALAAGRVHGDADRSRRPSPWPATR